MDMKPLVWIGSSREDLKKFPEAVRDVAGFALYKAQIGGKHPAAKPLKGFHGAGVVEIAENYLGNAYRIIYTQPNWNVRSTFCIFSRKRQRQGSKHRNRKLI